MSSGKWRPFCLGLNVLIVAKFCLMKIMIIAFDEKDFDSWLIMFWWMSSIAVRGNQVLGT